LRDPSAALRDGVREALAHPPPPPSPGAEAEREASRAAIRRGADRRRQEAARGVARLLERVHGAVRDEALERARRCVPPSPLRRRGPRPRGAGRPGNRRARAGRAGPSSEDPDDEAEPLAAAATEGAVSAWEEARQAEHLRRRFPTPRAFLDALDAFWGGRGHRTALDGMLHLGACPACRSRGTRRGWAAWPLAVAADDGPLDVLATCGCTPAAIDAALLKSERARIDAELAGLARGPLA
jgi:hypothetical protein